MIKNKEKRETKKKMENGNAWNVANHTSPIQLSTHTVKLSMILIGQNCIIRHDHSMISKGTRQSLE